MPKKRPVGFGSPVPLAVCEVGNTVLKSDTCMLWIYQSYPFSLFLFYISAFSIYSLLACTARRRDSGLSRASLRSGIPG